MKRYNVPRLAFINKLDRQGSNPQKIVRDLHTKLRLNASLTQLPIGLEELHRGVVDLVTRKAFVFEGANGVEVNEVPVRAPAAAAVSAALAVHLLAPSSCRCPLTWSTPLKPHGGSSSKSSPMSTMSSLSCSWTKRYAHSDRRIGVRALERCTSRSAPRV